MRGCVFPQKGLELVGGQLQKRIGRPRLGFVLVFEFCDIFRSADQAKEEDLHTLDDLFAQAGLTSALDLVSEELVMRNLRRVGGDRTIIMVTHRTAPLAICDQVAFMIDGRVEKVGKPAEIIPYARDRMTEGQQQRARQEQATARPDNTPAGDTT